MSHSVVKSNDPQRGIYKKEFVVDLDSGLLMEVENMKMAIEVGGGNTFFQTQESIKGMHIPSMTCPETCIALPRAQVIDCEDACSKTRLICNVEKKDECCKEKKKPKKEECSSGEESDPCEDEKEKKKRKRCCGCCCRCRCTIV